LPRPGRIGSGRRPYPSNTDQAAEAIGEVSTGAAETSRAVEGVHHSAQTTAAITQRLTGAVDRFLDRAGWVDCRCQPCVGRGVPGASLRHHANCPRSGWFPDASRSNAIGMLVNIITIA
jgi:hypothetical protein